MDTQFNVEFIENKRKKISCEHFFESSNPEYLKEATELLENTNLSMIFEAPVGYRLYMDGIDNLPSNQVMDDSRGTYIEPSSNPYELYNYDSKNSGYPFIPGTYFLTVITSEGEEYDARVKVASKRVTEDQHQLMIKEIESFLRGLSMDFSEKRSIYYYQAVELFGREGVEKYSFLLNNKSKIIHGLRNISKNRRYSIEKYYPVVPKPKAKRIDHRSMRYLATHPEQQSTIQVPQAIISYQTNENSWLKNIVSTILRYVVEMKRICNVNLGKEYDNIKKEVNDLHFHLLQFLNEKWMIDVKRDVSTAVPMAFFALGNYNLFYKIYRFLNGKDVEIATGSSKQFHYKRSDVLYETWGYLKVVESLMTRDGYHMKKNWFKLNRVFLDEIIAPKSEGFDVIELQKDDITLRIFYDEILPKFKKDINPHQTLYNLHHNRPDCRIDVWHDKKFIGSLVIDFKYRKKYNLWDDYLLSAGKEASKVMKQLASYADGMKTNTLLLNEKLVRQIDKQPVLEAWAIYPQGFEGESNDYELNDYDIRLIDLTPGKNHAYFQELLTERIKELLDR